jgi:hypothetical protein
LNWPYNDSFLGVVVSFVSVSKSHLGGGGGFFSPERTGQRWPYSFLFSAPFFFVLFFSAFSCSCSCSFFSE